MKGKIRNILGALALATTLGAAQAATPKIVIKPTIDPNSKPVATIQASADTNNYDIMYAGPAVRFQEGIGLPAIRYDHPFPENTGLNNPLFYNPLLFNPLRFKLLNGQTDCIPIEEYNSVLRQIAAALDSTKTIDWSSEKQAWNAALDAHKNLEQTNNSETDELFYCGDLGKALDILYQARLKNPVIASYKDILEENTELAERIGNLAARADSLSQELSRRARSNLVENEQKVAEPELSYVPIDSIMAAREIHPALEDSCYEETQTVPARTQEPVIVTYKRPGRNPLSATVYSAPGAGLNLDLGRLNLGFAVIRPHVNREQNLETRVTTNEPAPDFRTVYTEDISTEEGTYGAAYLGTLGYDLGGFSLLTGAELVNRECSGNQRNTIRHYIDNTQISEVPENVVLDKEETKKVYPVFGGMIPITDGTKIIGLYSTAGEYMVGLNFKLGGK